jgi:hypothetical protein
MTTGADIVDRIGTTTTTWDLRGDGIPDLRAALLTRKTTTIYEIGAERKSKWDIYDELSATVNVALDLIAQRIVKHLEGGGGNTGGCARLDGVETAGHSNDNNDDKDNGFDNGGRGTEQRRQRRQR